MDDCPAMRVACPPLALRFLRAALGATCWPAVAQVQLRGGGMAP